MMLKGQSRAVRPRFSTTNTVTRAPLKGLFSDDIWKCNCTPRLPAQHFQTKNGSKNHGRWFYVCQLPQTKRCDFFIWDDEAKGRERAAVLNNSRTEPFPEPTTPISVASNGLPTPQTDRSARYPSEENVETPYTPSKPPRPAAEAYRKSHGAKEATQYTTATSNTDDDEFFDWSGSGDDEVTKAVDRASQGASLPLPETPRKSIKSDDFASPGKRRYDDMRVASGHYNALPTPTTGRKTGDDVFVTPATSNKPNIFAGNNASPSIANTPSKVRYPDLSAHKDPSLAHEILTSLQTALSVPLFAAAQENIKEICNRHEMRTKGVIKGRDVLRDVVKKKEERTIELQSELDELKSERETDRSIIRHLRQELAAQKQVR